MSSCQSIPLNKLPFSLLSQLWKYDENTLSLENGNGAWQHQEIQWVLPNEGETGSMTDKGTSKVLGMDFLIYGQNCC